MMISKHKRGINLLVLQFGAAIAVSFAGFLYSRFLKHRRAKPSFPSLRLPSSDSGVTDHSSRGCLDTEPVIIEDGETQNTSTDDSVAGVCPSSESSADDKDVFLLPEIDEVVKEFDLPVCSDEETPRSDTCAPLAFPSEEGIIDREKEITRLRNTIRELHERERNLEAKLLEYYSLKEQQKVAVELRNRLKLNQMESKVFNLKIKSLQAENEKLRTEFSRHSKVVSELEAAKSRIQILKKQLQIEACRNRDQLSSLRDRVAKLQEQEAHLPDADADKMMQRLRKSEAEIEELRDSNARLRMENLELAQKLESTQLLANSKLEDPETEVLREEDNRMRNENEELKREIEQLRVDRCTDLEELVYLRWINACLRYELRNYQPSAGETKTVARDLSTTLSPRSEEKAKQLILEYARTEGLDESTIHAMDLDDDDDKWSSSLESLLTDSEYLDDSSSMDTLLASKLNNPAKKSLIRKLRKLLHGKEIHPRDACPPEHRDHLTSSASSVVHSSLLLQFRHSMDSEMLMRNKAEELKDHRKSETASSEFGKLREGETEPDSELAKKTELIKFAEALRNTGSTDKKIHKKSVSYAF